MKSSGQRICMLTLRTSIDSIIYNEAQTLAENGRRVVILARGEGRERQSQLLFKDIQVHWINLRTQHLGRGVIFWALKYLEALIRLILGGLREKADLYEAHDVVTLLPAWIVAKIKRKRLVFNAHELWTERPHIPAKPLWRWLERKLIPRADAIICPEENRAKILFKEYGARTQPMVVANCGGFRPIDRTTRLPDFLNSRDVSGEHIVIYQGMLSPSRCCEELIEAFATVSTDAVLVLMGEGTETYVELLRVVIARHKLGKKVFLHPCVPQEEVMAYAASADIGVALYRNNGRNNYYCAPTKLFEYLTAGMPVIVSDFPGMRKFVDENGIGLSVNPESPMQIAQAVDQLVSDSEMYQRMSQQSRWLAENAYNWQHESGKLLQVYDNVM